MKEKTFTANQVLTAMGKQTFADFYEKEFIDWIEDERHAKFNREQLIERLERILNVGKKLAK